METPLTPARSPLEREPSTIEAVTDAAAFEALAPDWRALLAASDADRVFLTWEWTYTWWRHLAHGARLQILLVRRGEELLGIAPFVLQPGSLASCPPVSTLQLLGTGVAGSDHLDLIVRKGSEDDVVRALAAHLDEQRRALSWMRVKKGGPAAALVDRLRRRGWRMWEGPVELCPFATLRGHSFDSYLQSLGREHRYGFRRKLGRLEREREPHFSLVRSEEERRDALSILFALHESRWHARGDAGAFGTPALRAFHDEWSRRALEAGWLRLWVLRLADRPVAALYAFLHRGVFSFYQGGFDPAYARDSLGMVLLGVAVRAAMEEGAEELDLLHGTERYKSHWAGAARELSRLELFAPGTRGALERDATAVVRRARRLARRALDLGKRTQTRKGTTDHAASS